MKFIIFSKKYRRLFRFDNFSHLFNDNWMVSYKKRDALILTLGKETTFYLPQAVFERNMREGARFFADNRRFRKYVEEYEAYIPALKKGFADYIQKPKGLDLKSLTKFLDLLALVWAYFYKTDFFYTEEAFKRSAHNSTIKKNLEIHYRLKERAVLGTRNISFFGRNCYLNVMLRKLARQFKIPVAALNNYSVSELKALYAGQRVSARELAARRMARIVVAVHGKVAYRFGLPARQDIQEFKKKTDDIIPYGAKFLKGMPANKGKAIGRVKIITSDPETIDQIHKEFAKMAKGDILVAETTTPEYMPAIRKAGAILADQGGLLSHAAVTAREFGIPAIVSLKYATKIFKDGDRVEVDADRGIVRRLTSRKI